MGSLSNLYISQSFTSLLHLGNDGPVTNLAPGQYTQFQDGLGNSLGISVNSSGDISSSGYIYAANIFPTITTASFNQYTASTNIRLNNLESTTASLNSSISQLNVSSASQQVSINALNQFTASNSFSASIVQLNQFTSSANIRLNNLESTSASVNISIGNLNTTTASLNSSVTQLNASSASQQVSINNLNSKTGSYAITGSNIFYGNQVISGSSSITFGLDVTNGIKADYFYTDTQGIFTPTLYGATAGLGKLQIEAVNGVNINGAITASAAKLANLNYPTADGTVTGQVLQTNAAGTLSFGNVSTIYETVRNGEATNLTKGMVVYISGSQGDTPIVYKADSANPLKMPAAYLIQETIAPNTNGRGITLGLATGINVDGWTAGTQLWIDGIGALTNVRPTGSTDIVQPFAVVTKSGTGGALNVLNPGPVLLPNIQKGYAWVGNGNNQPVAVATSSFGGGGGTFDSSSLVTTASFNAYTSSNNQRVTSLEANTASVNISITNINSATASLFTSVNNINSTTASLNTSASLALVTASFDVSTRNLTFTKGNTTQFSVNIPDVSGSAGNFVTTSSFNAYTQSNDQRVSSLESTSVSLLVETQNLELFSASALVSFSNLNTFTTSTLTRLTNIESTTASLNTSVSNLNSFSASTLVSISNLNASSASQQVSIDALNVFTASQSTASIVTSITNLNTFTSSANVRLNNLETTTASLLIETQNLELFSASALTSLSNLNTATASLFTSASRAIVTASVNLNTITFTKGDGTTFPITVNTGSAGGGAAFPYTGSAQITGSLVITGSLSGFVNDLAIVANTASMNFNDGNFFTLQLVSGSITHLTATNIKPGQTINLLVKMATSPTAASTGSLTFSPTFKFAGGFDYTPTTITGSQDLVSFVTFDTTQIFAAQIKNLL